MARGALTLTKFWDRSLVSKLYHTINIPNDDDVNGHGQFWLWNMIAFVTLYQNSLWKYRFTKVQNPIPKTTQIMTSSVDRVSFDNTVVCQ